ncbi:MAG TPA: DUF104 domain-containing protein [Blastocatellia bacterium]|nr:DUF104 domain-containing protein [Blastocatellia bacterium]
MLQTIEAEIDVNGTVRLLTPVKITKTTRAVLTLLDDSSPSYVLPPEITETDERTEMIEAIVRSMQANPLPPTAPHFTRDELHERR